jgi:DeoR/GlpR family transcriptional regulator of sugar metabolism
MALVICMPEMKIPATQRREVILKTIQLDGFVTVPSMAKTFRVSEMTLRRDLDMLAELKKLTRTHGGAISPEQMGGMNVDLVEPSVSKRATRNHDAKMAIAKHALKFLVPGQTIALDTGTTSFELAHLVRDIDLRVFTNSLKIAQHLSQSRPSTYVPGGQVSGTEPSIVGSRAIKHLNEFYFDFVFLGVSGLSAEGCFDYSLDDSEIKKALIARSKLSVVLLDSSKFDRMSVALVAKLEDIDILITEKRPPENLNRALETMGVRVELAQFNTNEEY